MRIQKKWRKCKLSSSDRYKINSYTDTQLNCYWNTMPSSPISVTKGSMIVPYSSPIICGIIENSNHECKYEEYADTIYEISMLSQFCGIFYAQTKTPMFISERDLFGVAVNYILLNAEVLMGVRSIIDDSEYIDIINNKYNKNKKEYIRGFYTLDIYHLRPWYERNSNYTKITYYFHLDLNGSIPNWIINGTISDTPKIILNLKKYIDENIKLLSKPGSIHIPLRMLEFIGIYVNDKLYKEVKNDKMIKSEICVQ